MTPGTRPERRPARAGPLPARSRAAARMVTMSAIADSFMNHADPRAVRGLHRLRAPASRGAAAPRRPALPRIRTVIVKTLVEQARYRALVADAPDRLGHERHDGELADFLGDAHRFGGEDAVGGDEQFHRRGADPRHRAARQHAVRDIGRYRFGAVLRQRLGSVAQRARAVDDVVDQDAAAPLDLADDVHHLGDAGALAPLVDDGEVGVEPLGDGAGAQHAADIGRNHHQIVAVVALLDVLDEDRRGIEVVRGYIEEALDLPGMDIEGEDAV